MNWILAIFRMPIDLFVNTITYYPGPLGDKLRYAYWKSRLGHLGKKVIISEGVFFDDPKSVFIGDHTWLDRYVYIMSGNDEKARKKSFKPNPSFKFKIGEVHIGTHCHIAPNCVINGIGGVAIGDKSGVATGSSLYSLSHHYRAKDDDGNSEYYFSPRVPISQQSMISGPIVVGEGCAIGLHCIILPGVHIGDGTWVGAGNVVKKSMPSNQVIGVDGRMKPKAE